MIGYAKRLLGGEEGSEWAAIESSEETLIGPEVRALKAAYEDTPHEGVEGDILEKYTVEVDEDGNYTLERPTGDIIEGVLADNKYI